MTSNFYPLNLRRFQDKDPIATPDTNYWDRLSRPDLLKEHTTIDYVDFSPSDPDNFVLTCSVRVQVYNLVTKLVVKNLSRFQKTAYGATFRQDGRLLAAGDEEGHVKLFDTGSRNILRLFKGHKAPVHRTFFTADKLQLASFADDKSVRMWDVSNEKVVAKYKDAHTDYIRAGAMHPQSSSTFVSGGYDGKINLYDTRLDTPIVRTLDHGSPVESMLYLPNGSIFISAGGTQVRVWDMISGCRLLTAMSQHHKTVTCLRLGSDGKRLLSGGLDRHVKIYDVNTYKTVHTLTYPNAVVSLGVAPNDHAVVAGMVDGLVSIRRMNADGKASKQRRQKPQRHARSHQQQVQKPLVPETTTARVDHVIADKRQRGQQLKLYDIHLRMYNYKKALDNVFVQKIIENHPERVVAVITELLHRDGLEASLKDRPEAVIIKFINFICKYVGETRFMRPLLNAANTLMDVFENNVVPYSKSMLVALEKLENAVQSEMKLTMQLMELKGALDMIIGSALDKKQTDSSCSYIQTKMPRMQPSKRAQQYVVVVD
ncbi:CG3071 [Drosophila busckii]|uniref:U3 small nucleolar RNA-associated protein 15 homolog n=1 Tax=Drosophila busckii TaxID=30019 RepID=A0A0M4EJW6_DROBS|nr:U3 small nucleolar RNA-associated protein 15 homolog [Drosophila busckii]ALC49528.1 CG3071 [Drosophila busckii]